MIRLAGLLCALGLARLLHAAAPEDTTLLFQVRHVQEEDQELRERFMGPPWDVTDGLPTVGYAFEKYGVGEYVEGKAKDGTWVPCIITGAVLGGRYKIHVADNFPGYDLPDVPWQLLRRPLTNETNDFYIDNSQLQHQGHGLRYRHTKSLNDKSKEYAPWGSLVVGHDDGDGWVRTAMGYVPYVVHGNQVMRQVDREKTNAFPTFERFIQRFKANRANLTTPAPSAKAIELMSPSDPVTFQVGEIGEFHTKGGAWHPMQVRGPGSLPGTYNIVVRPTDYSVYPVNNARVERLRKKKRKHDEHVPKEGEPPQCRQDGCLRITVRVPHGKKFFLEIARHGKLDMLMRMVCNKMKILWERCQKHATFRHKGRELSPYTFVSSSNLRDQDVVDMEVSHATTLTREDESGPPANATEEATQRVDVVEQSTEEPEQPDQPEQVEAAEETA